MDALDGFKGILRKAEAHARIYHERGYPEHKRHARKKLKEARAKLGELG